jgi:hypothetical protein
MRVLPPETDPGTLPPSTVDSTALPSRPYAYPRISRLDLHTTFPRAV